MRRRAAMISRTWNALPTQSDLAEGTLHDGEQVSTTTRELFLGGVSGFVGHLSGQ